MSLVKETDSRTYGRHACVARHEESDRERKAGKLSQSKYIVQIRSCQESSNFKGGCKNTMLINKIQTRYKTTTKQIQHVNVWTWCDYSCVCGAFCNAFNNYVPLSWKLKKKQLGSWKPVKIFLCVGDLLFTLFNLNQAFFHYCTQQCAVKWIGVRKYIYFFTCAEKLHFCTCIYPHA